MRIVTVVLMPILMLAQDGSSSFEVATIKPVILGGDGAPRVVALSLTYGPQGMEARRPLRLLLAEAYQVPDNLIEAPDAESSRVLGRLYDVVAKAEEPSTREQMRAMLRALLTERFGLKLHRESRAMDVYRLSVRKGGLRLRPSDAEPASARAHYFREAGVLEYRDATVEEYCKLLTSELKRHVVNATGLEGIYNFPFMGGAPEGEERRSEVLSRIRDSGLELSSERADVEFLVIDHAAPPTEN